jgi:hypothetical protein
MKTRAIVIATALAALTAGTAVHADQTTQNAKFCAAVGSFRSNVAQLRAISPQSTVAELRAATGRIDNDISDMQNTAKKMDTPTAKEFNDALKKVERDTNGVSDDTTLSQVHTQLQGDIDHARATGRQLAMESGCPAPATPQQGPNEAPQAPPP